MSNKAKSTISLLIAAIIWGSAFVAQRTGMDSIGPFYFCAFRSIIGSLALAAVFLISDRKASLHKERTDEEKRAERKNLISGGLVCGVIIFFAMNMQQVGLVSVDAGKAGFITALYIVLVPIMSIFLKQKTNLFTWIGVVLGVIGLYLLCITSDFSIEPGDLIILIGAFFWAFHILSISHFAPKVNVMKLTAAQFLVAGIISFAVAFFRETVSFQAVTGAGVAILYTAIFSTAIAFSFQALGQKSANPTATSIIMSTEALWAVVFGFLILGETLTAKELVGCGFMLAAVIISQLPAPGKKPDLPEGNDVIAGKSNGTAEDRDDIPGESNGIAVEKGDIAEENGDAAGEKR